MGFTDQLFILLDVIVAMVLGGVIGYEREHNDKPLGFRTNMIISGSAALLFSLGEFVIISMESKIPDAALGADPTRIIHAIIVGVSFIGAGTILKSESKKTVKYLTTAATILMSAGIGMAVALNLYWLAVGMAVLGVIVNAVVKKLYDHD